MDSFRDYKRSLRIVIEWHLEVRLQPSDISPCENIDGITEKIQARRVLTTFSNSLKNYNVQ